MRKVRSLLEGGWEMAKKMRIIHRILFNNALLAIAKVFALPHIWLIEARMRFIFGKDEDGTPAK